ncbi:MAG TPA: hypothetical protein VEA80_06355 [Vitreimonas sp.]|uniref:hypothetical protein n=1 Tax=Vitreimonas sp. TaxID=3069702 RepID=UPI002D4D2DBC|nr:hypothetical protein [Vitreimonas sp.]HYD87075.1 hypothetical protein [Vitreimonas sp.]
MNTVFLAGAAAALLFAGAAAAEPDPVPASPPPVQAPAQTSDVNVEGDIGNQTQTPPDVATQGPAAAEPAQTEAQAAANAEAMASSPAQPVMSASATDLCRPRVTTVHFPARGAALDRDNSNAIERAVDAASVCTLQQVMISAGGEGRLAARRAEAARATLLRQGVPATLISLSADAAGEAAAGQVDVRMNFAGVATGSAAAPSVDAPATTRGAEPDEAEQAPES